MKYTVILLPEEDGGYSVICPALPGCVRQGDNLQEALAMIKEAAELWLEDSVPPEETAEVVAMEVAELLREREEDGFRLTLETREVEVTLPKSVDRRPGVGTGTADEVSSQVIIPDTDHSVKPGVLRALIRHAGLTVEEFEELLKD